MYKIAITIALFVTSMLQAQTTYETGMNKAFALWGEGKIVDASNLFERIATAEKENWLPSYYAAQVLVLDAFSKLQDKDALDAQLKKAQTFVDEATSRSKNNPEIMVLQAMLHTAYVASDGATYGMTLSGKIVSLYSRAIELAPDNPRVVLSKAEWDMGSARYFGQDTKPFCEQIEQSLKLFDTFKPESAFHPNWGKERAEQLTKDCKEE
ncbi:hypothetical protein [Olleya aquimaris]|uniref:Tetratricopeptide repeat protein n=1 Tax=Olleya aquimaris TaxID=639310 RepID=A0A327RMT9_9FLAO|nr:hypothetical protein [Olleya aquimaris]RAJ16843.1 hypothetical protein LY08_00619 [Olleya aquimaris]